MTTPLICCKDDSLFCASLDGFVVKLKFPSVLKSLGNVHLRQKAEGEAKDQTAADKYLVTEWKHKVEYPVFSTPLIVSLDERMMVAIVINVKGSLFIFDYINDGKLLWTHSVKANVFSSPVLLSNNEPGPTAEKCIVFGAQDKYMHCIAMSKADRKTDCETSSQKCELGSLLNGDKIKVYEKWKIMHSSHVYSTPFTFHSDVRCFCQQCQKGLSNQNKTEMHVKNELLSKHTKKGNLKTNTPQRLFVASLSTDGEFNIVCAKSGTVLKKHKLGNNMFSSPVIINNKVIVGNRDNFLTCFKFQSDNEEGCDL